MMTLSPGPSCTMGAFTPAASRESCALGLLGVFVGGADAASVFPFRTIATIERQFRMLDVTGDHIDYITVSHSLSRPEERTAGSSDMSPPPYRNMGRFANRGSYRLGPRRQRSSALD